MSGDIFSTSKLKSSESSSFPQFPKSLKLPSMKLKLGFPNTLILLVNVPLQLFESVAVSVTEKVFGPLPIELKIWVGFSDVEVFPSPKSQV